MGFDLMGFSFFEIMTACPCDLSRTITVFCFRRTSFDAIRYALGSTERTTLPQVMIKGFKFRKEKLLLLWLKGVDEGLSSLLLQCLGIETMPVPHQRGLFKSIL